MSNPTSTKPKRSGSGGTCFGAVMGIVLSICCSAGFVASRQQPSMVTFDSTQYIRILPTDGTISDNPDPKPQITPDASSVQVLLLRPSCGQNYTLRSGEPVLLYYGLWGVRGRELLLDTAAEVKVELYIDGNRVTGSKGESILKIEDINCGSYLEDSYWNYHTVMLDKLSSGNHEVRVEYDFTSTITDGYDENEDGTPDTYGPDDSFYQLYKLDVD